MLKKILRNFFKDRIYPTRQKNWYKSKGYVGVDEIAQFEHFLSVQRNKGAIFYKEFKDLELKRQFIPFSELNQAGEFKGEPAQRSNLREHRRVLKNSPASFNSENGIIPSGHNHLDSVLISMPSELAKNKPGFGLCFIFFQGRAEYYESRFRDMARQCKATGASVLGFNPKGFNSSNGRIRNLKDMVDDGIAIVNYLLSQGNNLNQIILQGNSLGAAVQEMVSKHFEATMGTPLRQINSNSFKSLSAVFAHQFHLPFLEKLINKIMRWGEWEIEVDDSFYTTGPHRCYFRREGDRTILPEAEYHSMIDHERDYGNCPGYFKDSNKWLNAHTQLIYKNIDGKDPHDLSLHHFVAKPLSSTEPEYTIYDLINRFISNSKPN